MDNLEPIGDLGQGVHYGEWNGEAIADAGDPENVRLAGFFGTDDRVLALDVLLLEPLTDDRYVLRAYLAETNEPGDFTPQEIREIEVSSRDFGDILAAAFKRAHVRFALRPVTLDPDQELNLINFG